MHTSIWNAQTYFTDIEGLCMKIYIRFIIETIHVKNDYYIIKGVRISTQIFFQHFLDAFERINNQIFLLLLFSLLLLFLFYVLWLSWIAFCFTCKFKIKNFLSFIHSLIHSRWTESFCCHPSVGEDPLWSLAVGFKVSHILSFQFLFESVRFPMSVCGYW